MTLLSDEEIRAQLATRPGWVRDGSQIRRLYMFQDFAQAIAFVNRVAELAEAQDHHPEILVSYDKVTLTLSSHDAGGVTARDFKLAATIDA